MSFADDEDLAPIHCGSCRTVHRGAAMSSTNHDHDPGDGLHDEWDGREDLDDWAADWEDDDEGDGYAVSDWNPDAPLGYR